jgi:predicted nucleic acid-binding protein
VPVCVDASAALAWLLPHQSGAHARQAWIHLLDSGERLFAPPLFLAECTSVIREASFDGILTPAGAAEAVATLLELPVTLVMERSIYGRALELANRFQLRRAYDTQYLAAAEVENCDLLTVDRAMYLHSRELGIRAELLSP